MNKFGIIELAPDLKDLYEVLQKEKKIIMLALCYDLKANSCNAINSELIKFFKDNPNSSNFKLGGVTRQSKEKVLRVIERDFPGHDLENLIVQSKRCENCESTIDVMHRAFEMLSPFKTSHLVCIVKHDIELKSIGDLKTLENLYPPGLDITFLSIGEAIEHNFEVFIEDLGGIFVDLKDQPISNMMKEIKKRLEIN